MKNGLFVLGGISLAVLVGCGGGSSSSTGGNDNSLTISGTAATGAAISGGKVEYVCASGTGTGTTTSDGTGSYKVTVSGGTLPCLGQVTASDKSVYHTLIAADSSGATTATANITPMTELVVASVAGTDTSDYYASFTSMSKDSKTTAVTTAKVEAAQKDVKATLSDSGITTLGDTDLLKGTLRPGSSTDTYDKALETLKTNLATGGSDIKTLSGTVAASSATSSGASASAGTGAGSTTASSTDTPSLPASLLLKPKAATCAAMRSATYRYVGAGSTQKLTVDAEKLTVATASGSVFYLKAVDKDDCHFQSFSNSAMTGAAYGELLVSQAGLGVLRFYDATTSSYGVAVIFPEQKGYTVADAAGTWNSLSMEYYVGNTYTGTLSTTTYGTTGTRTSFTYCRDDSKWDLTKCKSASGAEAATNANTLRVNTDDNGFYVTEAGQIKPTGQRFVYKSGTGDVAVVGFWTDGSFDISTKQRTLPTPAGSNSYWQLNESATLGADVVTSGTAAVTSVADATSITTSFVRTNETTGVSPSDKRSETLINNTPSNGFRFRAAGTDTSVTPNQSYSRVNQLPLKGMGITVVLNESSKRFQVSVNKPN